MAKKATNVAVQDGALIKRLLVAFEGARRIDDSGREYWLAREFAEVLGYSWEGFQDVIERGKAALEPSDGSLEDHFRHVSKLITAGKGARRDIGDIELTRRACYLIGVNGDPRKKDTIAAVQRYFVEQTRKQEIREMAGLAGPDRDRLEAHRKLETSENDLKASAANRNVDDRQFETVRRRGHEALFNKSPDKLKDDLRIPKDRNLADFADPVIVKGMDFATSLTTRQIRENKKLKGVGKIGDANAENHAGVRGVMAASGAFPEKIPPVEDIKDVEQRQDRQRAKLVKLHSKD